MDDGRLTPALVEGSNEVPLSRSKYANRNVSNGVSGRINSFRSVGGKEKDDRGFLSEGYTRSEDGGARAEGSTRSQGR